MGSSSPSPPKRRFHDSGVKVSYICNDLYCAKRIAMVENCSFTYFGQRDAAIKPEISCVLNGLNHAGRGYKVHKNKYKGYSVSLDGSQQIAAKGIKNQSKRVKISDSSREEHCSDLTMRHNSKQISLSRDESLVLLIYKLCAP
nr:unnamed protein product [Ananas comosus var. bracteatus]